MANTKRCDFCQTHHTMFNRVGDIPKWLHRFAPSSTHICCVCLNRLEGTVQSLLALLRRGQ